MKYNELIESRKIILRLERDVWHLQHNLKFMTIIAAISSLIVVAETLLNIVLK
jgi:hypothetical protein